MLRIVFAASALMFVTAPAVAAPNPNAATVDRTDGCWVSTDGTDYVYDPACQAHFVTKYDQNGNAVSVRYQDKGTLQDGQTAPSSAYRNTNTVTYEGLTCTSTETRTPSGQYSSTMTC